MCVAGIWHEIERGPSHSLPTTRSNRWPNHTPRLAYTEEALTVLFCLIDDAYRILNPHGAHSYESIKRLSDSELITLALFQQLRGVQSERSFLREAERFFSQLFPEVVGLCTLTRSIGE
jgi:hypothetical protein